MVTADESNIPKPIVTETDLLGNVRTYVAATTALGVKVESAVAGRNRSIILPLLYSGIIAVALVEGQYVIHGIVALLLMLVWVGKR